MTQELAMLLAKAIRNNDTLSKHQKLSVSTDIAKVLKDDDQFFRLDRFINVASQHLEEDTE